MEEDIVGAIAAWRAAHRGTMRRSRPRFPGPHDSPGPWAGGRSEALNGR